MKNEQLDETIDRVAAELTAVSADAGFSTRLRDQLQQQGPRRRWWSPLVLASAAAVLFVAAVVIFKPALETENTGAVVRRPAANGPTEPPVPAVAVVEPARSGPVVARSAARPSDPTVASSAAAGTPDARVEDVAMAEAPGTLIVEALRVEPVEVPAAADIAPLRVPDLQISDIGIADVAKEPR